MFCRRSVGERLARGAAALALLGALRLLRGCPMSWLMGLFETVALRRDRKSI